MVLREVKYAPDIKCMWRFDLDFEQLTSRIFPSKLDFDQKFSLNDLHEMYEILCCN